ncbi:MAG: esterase-like activity of phytase family protein [Pseudomonadota bacterium]
MRLYFSRLFWCARAQVCAVALITLVASVQIGFAQQKVNPSALKVQSIRVDSTVINSFDKVGFGRTKFGKLEWIGGLRLTSKSAAFGGWSGLAIDPGGRGFLAVSDAGTWMRGRFDYDAGRLKAVSAARLGPLLSLKGRPLGRGRDRDAEAVAVVNGTTRRGNLLIAFEQNHRIGRFKVNKRGVRKPSSYVRPRKPDRKIRFNKGFEAITVLKKGRYKGSLLAIAERRHTDKGHHSGWVWVRGKPKRFSIIDKGGHDITDVAALPDGGVLLLERRFRWLEGVRFRVRYVPVTDIRPGAVIDGDVLIEADLSQNIDNMEALAVHQSEDGAFILTILSDDNFNPVLQQTLLLQFRWRHGDKQLSQGG